MGKLNIPVRSTIAVASGKGGVGKTTVAVNLAVALAQAGAQGGLMDADVYGPNIPIMMGINEQPHANGERIIPLEAHGRQADVDGLFGAAGPGGHLARSDAAQRHPAILERCRMGDLDYLVIDLPPGTGDAQLTLAQSVPLTGASSSPHRRMLRWRT